MLDGKPHIQNIVHRGYFRRRREHVKSHRRGIGTSGSTVDAVRKENSVWNTQSCILIATNRIHLNIGNHIIAYCQVHFVTRTHRMQGRKLTNGVSRRHHSDFPGHDGLTTLVINNQQGKIKSISGRKIVIQYITSYSLNGSVAQIPSESRGRVALMVIIVIIRITASGHQMHCIIRTKLHVIIA